jgi:signal peptidase II
MRVLWISAVVLFVDQVTKITVLNTMYRHESIALVGDWLRLTFTENPGMAFGIQVGPPGTVSVLASVATLLIAAYIWQVRHTYLPYRISLAFIFGGALGNIVDRIFYGEILGYGHFFTGRVVDFIHVSLWQGFVPESVPLVGGTYIELFPIWNVADMAIVLGVVGVLALYRGFHEEEMERRRAEIERAERAAEEDARGTAGPEAGGERAPAGSSTTEDPAPAMPEAAPRNGNTSDEHVTPDGPSDSAPPEVPILEDTSGEDAEAEATDAPATDASGTDASGPNASATESDASGDPDSEADDPSSSDDPERSSS